MYISDVTWSVLARRRKPARSCSVARGQLVSSSFRSAASCCHISRFDRAGCSFLLVRVRLALDAAHECESRPGRWSGLVSSASLSQFACCPRHQMLPVFYSLVNTHIRTDGLRRLYDLCHEIQKRSALLSPSYTYLFLYLLFYCLISLCLTHT